MFLLKNLGLRILAVASAILFWVFIVGLKSPVYLFPESIVASAFNLSEKLSIVNELPSVKVTVSTDADTFRKLTKDDFEVYIDLKGLQEGSHQVDISVTSRNPRVSIVRTEPKSVPIVLEPKASKEFELEFKGEGSLPPKTVVKSVSFSPARVKVSGSKSVVESMKKIPVAYRFSGNEKGEMTVIVPLSVPNLSIDPAAVSVKIVLQGELKKKIVPVKVRTIETGKQTITTSVTPSTVEIEGSPEIIAEISSVETEPLDLTNVQKSFTKKIPIALPEGVSVTSSSPKEVTVKITIAK